MSMAAGASGCPWPVRHPGHPPTIGAVTSAHADPAQAIAAFRTRMDTDPEFARLAHEEFRCFAESLPYVSEQPAGCPAEPCDGCGTMTYVVALALIAEPRESRQWRTGLREAEPGGYVHTPRRCAWRARCRRLGLPDRHDPSG